MSMISSRTVNAINRLAKANAMEVKTLTAEKVVLDDGFGAVIEAHRVGHEKGPWVLATHRNGNWRSSDMPASWLKHAPGYSFTFADTLEGLVSEGIQTHIGPLSAVRHALHAMEK